MTPARTISARTSPARTPPARTAPARPAPGRPLRAALLAALIAAPGAGVTAQPAPDRPMAWDVLSLRAVSRLAAQTGIAALRSAADVTYEAMTVSADGAEVGLTGVVLRLPAGPGGPPCVARVDRIDLSGGADGGRGTLRLELFGLSAPLSCLPPEATEGAAMLGYDALSADFATLDLAYDMGPSALDARLHVELTDAAAVDLETRFDYVWLRDRGDGGDPEPVAILRDATLAYEDGGLIARLRAAVPPDSFDFARAEAIIGALLEEALPEDGSAEGARTRARLIAETSSAVGGLLTDGGRITAALRPEAPISLDDETLALLDAPAAAIALLAPRVTRGGAVDAPPPPDPAMLSAALSAALNPGLHTAAPAPADRRAAGLALLSGRGAPLAPAAGLALLGPLAQDDPTIAAELAAALEDDAPEAAYAFALAAAAAGIDGAAGLRDRIEGALTAAQILRLQPSATEADFDAAIAAAAADGARGLRRAALALAAGTGAPRSYAQAYVAASLAAAAGDPAAGALRDRIARRLQRADPAVWAEAATRLNARALSYWTEGGVAQALSAR